MEHPGVMLDTNAGLGPDFFKANARSAGGRWIRSETQEEAA